MTMVGELKQHVPVFVGSTFEDLKEYRRAVRDSLSQLEMFVRGMEYFGSKPGSPLDECLAVVASCKVYIGIFGMRYGSIPEGHDRSMTHLEYDEAQRCQLPSLIYIIDEDEQPVLPKYVDTGPGADALQSLKETLKKRHLVSTFTSPDDLARRVLHDVPEVLRSIGTKVDASLPGDEPTSFVDLLRKFTLLPKLFRARDVTIEFEQGQFHSVAADECEALRLETGATICGHMKLSTESPLFIYVYASGEIAEQVLDVPRGAHIRAVGSTVYGTSTEIEYGEDGAVDKIQEHSGVSLRGVTAVDRQESSQDSK
jgi:hypothetical protein